MTRRFRAAERAAHAASAAAVVLTLVAVGTAHAAESNPAAAWLIGTVGLEWWALATPLGVGAVYTALRWWADRGAWPPARRVAWAIAAVLALDALGNAVALAWLGGVGTVAPGTVYAALGVATLAVAVGWRRALAAEARALVAAVPRDDRPLVGALVVLVVLSAALAGVPASMFGPGAPAETVHEVRADSPNGAVVYSGSNDGTVKAVDPSDNSTYWTYSGFSSGNDVEGVAVGPDKELVYAVSDDTSIVALYAANGSAAWSINPDNSGKYSVAPGPAGDSVYVGDGAGSVYALDTTDGSQQWKTTVSSGDLIYSLDTSPDGSTVYAGVQDYNAYALSATNGSIDWTFSGHTHQVKSVAAGPDGTYVYTASRDNTVRRVYAANGTQDWSSSAHASTVYDVTVGPNGTYLYTGDLDGKLKRLYAANGSEDWSISPFGGFRVYSTSVSKDGSTVFGGSTEPSLRGFDADTNTETLTFTGHSDAVRSVAGLGEPAWNAVTKVTVSGTVTYAENGSAVNNADIDALDANDNLDAETTTNSSGFYEVKLSDDDYTIQATKGNLTGSTDVTVSGSDVTNANISIGDSSLYVAAASPQHEDLFEWYEGSGDVPFKVRPIDERGRNVTVTLQVKSGGSYSDQGSTTVTNNTTATIKYEPDPYRHQWRVELNTSDGRAVTSPAFGVNRPGYLEVLNGSDGTRITDATVQANVTAPLPGDQTPLVFNNSASDGLISLRTIPDGNNSGADGGRLEIWSGDVEALSAYNNSTVSFGAPVNNSVVLYPNDTTGLYEQCFKLTDKTGEYPPADSFLEVQAFISGTFVTAASSAFGVDNRACPQIKDGQDYRLLVHNSKGDVRGVGSFEGDTNRSDEVVELVIGDTTVSIGGDNVDVVGGGGLWGFDGTWNDTDSGAVLRAEITTQSNYTLYDTTLEFYEFRNKSNVSFAPVQLGPVKDTSYKRPLNESWENKTWVIELRAEGPDGQPVRAKAFVGRQQNDITALGPTAIPPWLSRWGAFTVLLLTAGAFSQRNVALGGLVIPVLAGLFFYIGWWGGTVTLAGVAGTLTLGALYYMGDEMTPA